MKVGWMVSEIFNVFSFPVDTFSTWKMETKLYGNLYPCPYFNIFEYLDPNQKKYLELVE